MVTCLSFFCFLLLQEYFSLILDETRIQTTNRKYKKGIVISKHMTGLLSFSVHRIGVCTNNPSVQSFLGLSEVNTGSFQTANISNFYVILM